MPPRAVLQQVETQSHALPTELSREICYANSSAAKQYYNFDLLGRLPNSL